MRRREEVLIAVGLLQLGFSRSQFQDFYNTLPRNVVFKLGLLGSSRPFSLGMKPTDRTGLQSIDSPFGS